MNVSKLYGGTNRTAEDCQVFLRDGYDLLCKLVSAYDLIAKYNSPLNIELMPGISEQDARDAILLDGAEDVVGMNLGLLADMLLAGKFGEGVHALRMKRAVEYAQLVSFEFENMTIVPDSETLRMLKNNIEFAIGNWLYGFASTLDLDTIISWSEAGEPFSLDHEVEIWISRQPAGNKIFNFMAVLKTRFIPLVEAFVQYPHEWEEFVTSVPAEYRDDILLYADNVYISDIIAFRQGQIQIDETYVQLLRDRGENANSLESQNSDIVAKFIKYIPAMYAHIMVTYANQLTLDLMMQVINGQLKVDAKFVANLEDKKANPNVTRAFEDM